jgi:hypothetical protein
MSKRLALFDQLISAGSKDPFHHYARALELRSLGRASDALEALAGTIALFPEYVPSYLIAAQLAVEQGDSARARELASEGMMAAKRAGNDHALGELEALLQGLP